MTPSPVSAISKTTCSCPEKTLEQAKTLKPDGLRGSYVYYDGLVNDSRLTIETVKDGVRHGGLALNYARVTGFRRNRGRIAGACVRDAFSGSECVICANHVVNATGISCDTVRKMDDPDSKPVVSHSKGTHLVFRKKDVPIDITLTFPSPIDGRALFLVNQPDCVLLGTTDEWDTGDPEHPVPGPADTEYLLKSVDGLMPGLCLTRDKILYAYSGYRPLISPKAGPTIRPR